MQKRARILLGSLAAALVVGLVPATVSAEGYWQCVPFARLLSGIQIFGDARTWWSQAISNKYETGGTPQAGSVLCFKPTSRMRLGHVAVVSQVLTDRVIQITHANWSVIEGDRGQVEKDVTVVDVSPAGDWTQVKVWYDPVRDLGNTVYPTYGFIYQNAQAVATAAVTSKIALAQDAAVAMAQSAASQVVNTLRPGGSPMGLLGQMADSGDRIAALIAAAAAGQPEPTQTSQR